MLTIKILTVGKLKEKYLKDAVSEYLKRLSRYCKAEILELKEELVSENPVESEIKSVLLKEGKKIFEKIGESAFVVALCVEGEQMTSEKFSRMLEKVPLSGCSEVVFIIGSSHGLSDEVKNRADLKLSFSEMTFPHQLMRVILLEQIYRGFNISSGGKYHK